MNIPRPEPRQALASQDQMSALEYALAASFVVMALLAAIPGLAAGLSAAAKDLLAHFA